MDPNTGPPKILEGRHLSIGSFVEGYFHAPSSIVAPEALYTFSTRRSIMGNCSCFSMFHIGSMHGLTRLSRRHNKASNRDQTMIKRFHDYSSVESSLTITYCRKFTEIPKSGIYTSCGKWINRESSRAAPCQATGCAHLCLLLRSAKIQITGLRKIWLRICRIMMKPTVTRYMDREGQPKSKTPRNDLTLYQYRGFRRVCS